MNEETNKKIQQEVYARLQRVMDPELDVNIVDLGLVYDVTVRQDPGVSIEILLTLTTPGCPLASVFDRMIKDALWGLEGVTSLDEQVKLTLTFDPPWVTDMMSEEAKAALGM